MAEYYYLVSSLPDLVIGEDLPLSYDEFIKMCSANVSEEKLAILSDLTLSYEEGPIAKQWSEFYGNLTKELNFQRSQLLGKSYPTDYDKDSITAKVAAEALNAKNPLEAEKILLDYEFKALDDIVGLHTYDDEFLFGYAIKLKLLERQNCFVTEKGKAEFKRLFDGVQQSVYSL